MQRPEWFTFTFAVRWALVGFAFGLIVAALIDRIRVDTGGPARHDSPRLHGIP